MRRPAPACRDKLTGLLAAARDRSTVRRDFDAVLAGYKDGLGDRPRNIHRALMRHLPSLWAVVFMDLPSPIHFP